MLIIPAIDIKDGRCVRLRQGKAEEETVFSGSPEDVAKRWYELGAERIHVVDLNGAFEGKPVNFRIVEKIVKAVPIPIEVGGGIRSLDDVELYINIGVRFIIFGTSAIKSPEVIIKSAERYPGRIILSLDAKEGKVSVEGWKKKTDLSIIELAKRFEKFVCSIIYTDIKRDGMKSGPNIAEAERLAKAVNVPVIISGGVSSLDDIKKIVSISKCGIEGIIIGRALYDGDISLVEAIKIAKGE